MRAWHDFRLGSIFWRAEMEKVAVFPVPDWAWAMTSLPFESQSSEEKSRSKNRENSPLMMGMIARC